MTQLYTVYDPADPGNATSGLTLSAAMNRCMTTDGGQYAITGRPGGGWVLWTKKADPASWELTEIHSLNRGKREARAEILAWAAKRDWPLECISDQGFAAMQAAKAEFEAKGKAA